MVLGLGVVSLGWGLFLDLGLFLGVGFFFCFFLGVGFYFGLGLFNVIGVVFGVGFFTCLRGRGWRVAPCQLLEGHLVREGVRARKKS